MVEITNARVSSEASIIQMDISHSRPIEVCIILLKLHNITQIQLLRTAFLGFQPKYKTAFLCHHRQTDDNGGVHELITKEQFVAGLYKIELDTASYWKSLGLNPFHHHADVSIHFLLYFSCKKYRYFTCLGFN